MKDGTIQDLIGGFTPDAGRHGVSNVFGNTNPESKGFSGVRRKQRIMDFAMNRFQPRELEERTDVSNMSCGQEDGLTVVKQWV